MISAVGTWEYLVISDWLLGSYCDLGVDVGN